MRPVAIVVAVLLAVAALPAFGEEKKDEPKRPLVREDVVRTEHEVEIGGEKIAYVATAGTMALPDYQGKRRADLFFIAYERKDAGDAAARPLTFSFNGGPGSSSVWLHLGALGPKRVPMEEEGWAPPPPYRLVPNEGSWLDFTDLVFIDPVTTGYSRPAEGKRGSEFHGLYEDVESVGEFIRLYTTRRQRWLSPKFIIGESYGTTRAAQLSGHLQEELGMYLNGVILVSPVLNFQASAPAPGNDLAYWLYLPTYAATAWFHGKLGGDRALADVVKEATEFARTDYLLALARGDGLAPEARLRMAERVAALTGLSVEFVLATNLRIDPWDFRKELLRGERKTVGRLDSRFLGTDRKATGEWPEYDPSMEAIRGPYTAAIYDYLRGELSYENDLVYEVLTGRVHPWSYQRHQNRYVNVAETLRGAMTRNPDLKVLYACGYFDLATPFFAMDYTAAHMQLPPELRKNVTATYYESGHMMYIRVASLMKLRADAKAFYEATLAK
jgi:carboxypeptidase C (cathepsin A)